MKQRGLSGSTLKIIAIITMLIDHTAAAVLARLMEVRQLTGRPASLDNGELYVIYSLMRNIGRIAFPIFCFLLAEGFLHTRSKRKYAFRLGLFALLSEPAFDLAFSSRVLEVEYQNVYFTLFFGVLTMLLYHKVEEQKQWGAGMQTLAEMAVVFAGMGIAELARTDYGALGVLCIMVPYMFRQDKKTQIVAGVLSFFWWEPPAVLAFIPIAFYNGKRGINLKYVFYIFYPAHLLILYLICKGMGIADIAAL